MPQTGRPFSLKFGFAADLTAGRNNFLHRPVWTGSHRVSSPQYLFPYYDSLSSEYACCSLSEIRPIQWWTGRFDFLVPFPF